MKQFSANGSPLPPLAVRISHLAAEPVAVLDRSKVAHPATRVAESFWSVTEQLHEMLAALNFGDLDGHALARRMRSILGHLEFLLHRCGEFNSSLDCRMRTFMPRGPGPSNTHDSEPPK